MNITPDNHFDGILFDMDGTLWDAVSSYCAVWNATIAECCPEVPEVTYDRLSKYMGRPLRVIFDDIIGDHTDYGYFMERLGVNEDRLMPVLGGKLYPGVFDTIRELSKSFPLFMVSNCTPLGLPNFLEFTGLKPFFTDHISYGDTGLEKDRNIRLMAEKYVLKHPLYVGDTVGDMRSAHAADAEFAWAAYGFGHDVEGYDYRIDRVEDLLSICKPLKTENN